MWRQSFKVALLIAFVLASDGAVSQVFAQGATGELSGSVVDVSQAMLPGVSVTVINEATNTTRMAATGADGTFRFTGLLPGTYTVKVTLTSFRSYEQKGVVLSATERLTLRPITLELGQLAEAVTVQGDTPLVRTTDGARSATVPREQIEEIASKGRVFTEYIAMLPGVVMTASPEFSGSGNVNNLTINGRSSFNFNLDGVTNKDTGANSGNYASPALDSIAEIKVQTSSFQAEYGRSSGATITVVTRSGSKNFHGSGAFYLRNEALNANEWQRKQNCDLARAAEAAGQTPQAAQLAQCDKPYYRYNNTAWTLGGPILLPGTDFNRNRDKLFFFFSQDLLPRHDPGTLTLRRVPTALERAGDFSQTRNLQGQLLFIKDPTRTGACNATSGGPACFTDNRIPSDRINSHGLSLLSLLPMPNQPMDANGNNHVYQSDQKLSRSDQVVRVDYNLAQNTTFYSRGQWGYELSGNNRFEAGWPVIPQKASIRTFGVVNTLLHTFNSSTVMEATVGMTWSHQELNEVFDDQLDRLDRRTVLPGWNQFFPEANSAFRVPIVPGVNFNGGLTPNPPNYGPQNENDRFPFFGYNKAWNLSANVSKLKGNHNLKAGVFVDYTLRPAAAGAAPYGVIDFSTANGNQNPCNSNIGIANALLGCIQQYTESDRRAVGHGVFYNLEWYLQDNWRVSRNFTLDAGLRFYRITPAYTDGDAVAQFEPLIWQTAKAPTLYQPTLVNGQRLSVNPINGVVGPTVNIGRMVPGSGDPYNGMVVYENGNVFSDTGFPALKLGPRVGFAYDPRGDGLTSFRGGAGVYYDRFPDHEFIALVQQPPVLQTYTLNFTTVPQLQNATLLNSPRNVSYWPTFNPPLTYNWNVGVQRDLGFLPKMKGLVVDFAYVGSASRNQLAVSGAGAPTYQIQLNGRPPGYRFLPSSLDPTNISNGQAQPLPDDLLRPYQGFSSIVVFGQNGYADYHSLQLSLTRRLANGLSFGAAYTYELVNKRLQNIAWELDPNCQDVAQLTDCGLDDANRDRFYTSAGRRPHTARVNFSYHVPGLSGVWDHVIVKSVFDNWQVSGVGTFQSGPYGAIGWSYTNVPTGALVGNGQINSGMGSRVHYTCDPNLPRSERSFYRQFRTECVAPATDQYWFGDSRGDEYLGLGYVNWDLSLFKNVALSKGKSFQFRIELYNAFNANQWSALNSNAQFDYTTKALANATTAATGLPNFGSLTGATRSARRIQLGARFTF